MNLAFAWQLPRLDGRHCRHCPCLPFTSWSSSFPGNEQVNTISINQVLSNENLISYNKFVQVQGPGLVSGRWAWLGTEMGMEV